TGLLRESALPVLVDFWAPWCGPCRMVAPEMSKVAERNAGRFLVVKVNTDVDQRVGAEHRIQSIPTMAVFRGGKEVARTMGARPAAQIEGFVRQAIGAGEGAPLPSRRCFGGGPAMGGRHGFPAMCETAHPNSPFCARVTRMDL